MAVTYPNIDPVAFEIGPVPIRWYSLGYIGGIVFGWLYILSLLKNAKLWPSPAAIPIKRELLDDLIFWWVLLGVMVGGRVGYLLFYEPALLVGAWEPLGATMKDGFLKDTIGRIPIPPALMLWRGGMSFHGGFLGVVIAGLWFCRRHKLNALSAISSPSQRRSAFFSCASLTSSMANSMAARGTVPGLWSFRPTRREYPGIRASFTRPRSKGSFCSAFSASPHMSSIS